MVDFKDYSCYLDSPLNYIADITKDIVFTCEEDHEYSSEFKHQEYVVSLAHYTLKPKYAETLMLFVGVKYFHWFYESGSIQKSVHLNRQAMLHFCDQELIDVFLDALDNRDEWLDCDINEVEALMPHYEGNGLCFECDTRWDYSNSILSKERGVMCPLCEGQDVVFNDKRN